MKRGNLLWVGSRMMLAEHRQLLNEKNKERKNIYKKNGVFDEQQVDEWQNLWAEAIINDLEVVIELDNRVLKQASGKIVNCNLEEGCFYLQLLNGERVKILVSEIKDLMIK